MNLEELNREIEVFSKGTHGSSDYDQDEIFVMGEIEDQFAPLRYLIKKVEGLENKDQILKSGYSFDSYEFFPQDKFQAWFERQFAKKLNRKVAKKIFLLHRADDKSILTAIESVNKSYDLLRKHYILLNGKNLPVQLGEWYAKCIFGLRQVKSTSQRGFDFYLADKRIEVKVSWADKSSPKGVKIRKSLVEMSDYSIIIYLAQNFMIREICFLDSEFVLRKFSGKGHTIFLKDGDVLNYFFSKSSRHDDKVANSSALLRFASPTLAMKIAERYQ